MFHTLPAGNHEIVGKGTCQLCGKHYQDDLRIMAIADFIGWVCPECFRQLKDSMERRFIDAGERTEPAE